MFKGTQAPRFSLWGVLGAFQSPYLLSKSLWFRVFSLLTGSWHCFLRDVVVFFTIKGM